MTDRPLAIVTGASSGIGRELARLVAADGYDLLIAANEPEIEEAARDVKGAGAVETVQCDLGTEHGVQELVDAVRGRAVAVLMANAGTGVGGLFLDQDFTQAKDVIDVNVTGTISLIHTIARGMRDRGAGRILITGSIVDDIPGPYNLIYNASKAFIESFGYGLRNELKDTNVSVTILMPGLTDTKFFERADMEDTGVGQSSLKDDPADVARDGYEAMKNGEAAQVGGNFTNSIQSALSKVLPDTLLAEVHRHMAKPKR